MHATLHFHSFAAKLAFTKRNGIHASEIISETPGSITMLAVEAAYFSESVFVYRFEA